MLVRPSKISGLVALEPVVRGDARGYFVGEIAIVSERDRTLPSLADIVAVHLPRFAGVGR